MRLRIASRKSDLARLQAKTVGRVLDANLPDLEIEYEFSASMGDKNLDMDLRSTGDRGVFTQDLQNQLIAGKIDMVVHSWKDLPIQENPFTYVAATLPREDMRDLLLIKKTAWSTVLRRQGLNILTSSPRREYHLSHDLLSLLPGYLEGLEFSPVRGNIPTRMEKLMTGQADGLVIAKAALDRMLAPQMAEFFPARNRLREWLGQCYWMVLPLSLVPCAPAQGALAIEISKKAPEELKLAMDQINCFETFECVQRERQTLAQYGGGCHQKIGVSVIKRPYGYVKWLRGQTDAGEVLDEQILMNQFHSHIGVKPEQLWPQSAKQAQFFEREFFDDVPQPAGDLWVARASALPESWRVSFDQTVWCSGVKSWQKLAQRGVWVNGSSESLGEVEDPRIDELLGRKPSWNKLTHTQGQPVEGWNMVPTYELKPSSSLPDLGGKEHFFWMSGSQFTHALQRFPEIKNKSHACGPGHSYRTIARYLDGAGNLKTYLSFEHWKREMGGATATKSPSNQST